MSQNLGRDLLSQILTGSIDTWHSSRTDVPNITSLWHGSDSAELRALGHLLALMTVCMAISYYLE